jgi:hypothetical protein
MCAHTRDTHTHTHKIIIITHSLNFYYWYRDVIECELKSTDALEDPEGKNTEVVFRTEEEGVCECE